jgi:hypothetical protein
VYPYVSPRVMHASFLPYVSPLVGTCMHAKKMSIHDSFRFKTLVLKCLRVRVFVCELVAFEPASVCLRRRFGFGERRRKK